MRGDEKMFWGPSRAPWRAPQAPGGTVYIRIERLNRCPSSGKEGPSAQRVLPDL